MFKIEIISMPYSFGNSYEQFFFLPIFKNPFDAINSGTNILFYKIFMSIYASLV